MSGNATKANRCPWQQQRQFPERASRPREARLTRIAGSPLLTSILSSSSSARVLTISWCPCDPDLIAAVIDADGSNIELWDLQVARD